MGWASAGEIFDPVARELIAAGAPDGVITRVCAALIKQLQAGDWDTEDESWNEFTDHPAVLEAFRQCDAYPQCGRMSPDNGPGKRSWCRLEKEHDGDHDDKRSRTWPQEVEG
jgi:hypothetical protein